MLKFLKRILILLLTVALVSAMFTGCLSTDEEKDASNEPVKLKSIKKGFTGNDVYVIKAEDFEEFKENALGGNWKKFTYEVPVVDEMLTGETYYIIGHTYGQTKDGRDIQFDEGRLQIYGRDVYRDTAMSTYKVIDHLSFGSFCADETDVELVRDTMYGDNSYDVKATADGKKSEFFVYIEIKVQKEMKMHVNYSFNGTVKDDEYGEKQVAKTAANVYYTEKIEISDFKIRYLEGKDYVDGRYSESSLKDSIDMEVGKTYYLVVSVNVQSMLEKADGETLTLETVITHLTLVNGTLDSADSGNFTETVDGPEKSMKVTFKIPDPSEGVKKYDFVYKLIPITEDGYPWMYFKIYTNSEVSVMGGYNWNEIKLPFGMEEAGGTKR